jgi:flagellar motor protein MotB
MGNITNCCSSRRRPKTEDESTDFSDQLNVEVAKPATRKKEAPKKEELEEELNNSEEEAVEDDDDEDFATESEGEEARQKLFDEFCEDFLELDKSHVEKGVIVDFNYFT